MTTNGGQADRHYDAIILGVGAPANTGAEFGRDRGCLRGLLRCQQYRRDGASRCQR